MVIFEDLRKLLLYQKLNLGFECQLCKKTFFNRIDHLEHSRSCKSVPDLKCPKCGKQFGHVRILQLHLQFHNVSESSAPQLPDEENTKKERSSDIISAVTSSDNAESKGTNKINEDEMKTTLPIVNKFDEPSITNLVSSTNVVDRNKTENGFPNSFKILEASSPKKKSSYKTKEKPKQVKKQVGLTKIKMEDCLRCDACSCIYIDEKDYYKHMRNFHQRDVNNSPIKQQKVKRKCRSCCKQCRGSHCASVKRPRATQRASNLIFRFTMKDNIKNRWTQMVSQQLADSPIPDSTSGPSEPDLIIKPDPDANITIKQEPEPDLSYLLSQVEVKIKTEPPDDY